METCEIQVIEDPKQLKLLTDETRQRIICSLRQGAMSLSQLARKFNKTPATIHYHIQKLERAGLVRLERTQIVNNNLIEKYYRLAISPCIVGLGISIRKRGPVPPKEYGEMKANLKMFLEQIMSQFQINYKNKKAQQLMREMENIVQQIIFEADEAFKGILTQLNLKLSPYDQRRIQRIASAIPVLTFCQLICKRERLAVLGSLIRYIQGNGERK